MLATRGVADQGDAAADLAPGAAVAVLDLILAAHRGFSVNLFALTTDVAPSGGVGAIVSIAALCGNLAGMVVLQIAGVLVGTRGGYAWLFGGASVIYLLSPAWIQLLMPSDSGRMSATNA